MTFGDNVNFTEMAVPDNDDEHDDDDENGQLSEDEQNLFQKES